MKSIQEKSSGAEQTEPVDAQADRQSVQPDNGTASAGGRPVENFIGIERFWFEAHRPQGTIFPDPGLHPGISVPVGYHGGSGPDTPHPCDGPGSIALPPPWNCPVCGLRELRSRFCPECGTKMPEPKPASAWVCPACGEKGNKGGFCSGCGAKKPAFWTCPVCGAADNTTGFCSECGSKKPDVRTCPECGEDQSSAGFCPECGRKKPEQDSADP